MEINNTSKSRAELILSSNEGFSLIKILQFVLKELEYEYFTRTGFYENETKILIETIETSINENDIIQKIKITHQQIFNLRQNLVEILFGMQIKNYNSFFGISKEKLTSIYKLIDKYGEESKIWE